jgi:pre-mRNA-splicing factor ISY1
VGKKVMEIQNAALGEHKLRDLNDEINKLVREKGHWEKRIVQLGGPNYSQSKTTQGQGGGDSIDGKGQGYRYFGAAKSLPGVKELFEKQVS